MPGVEINEDYEGLPVFKPDQMVVHDIKPTDHEDCEGTKNKWTNDLKYDQAVSIGCGKIGTPGPYHNYTAHADMYDAFAWFTKNGKDVFTKSDFIEVGPLTGLYP
jgi:hypothetical protein